MQLIKTLTIAFSALALIATIPACDSDTDSGGTNTGGTNTGGTNTGGTNTGGVDAGEHNDHDTHEEHHADGAEHHDADGPEGEGACTNEADQAVIAENDVPALTQTAAFACLADEDPGACTAASVAADTGMSEACVACYAEQVTCALEYCAADCIADAEGEACTTCRESNCTPLFAPCSGIAPTTTDE